MESAAITSDPERAQREPLAVRHALLVLTSPRRLFARVEDTGTYGWTLVAMVGMVTLLGYAEVKTGLIDQDVDQQTETALAELEESQGTLLDRIELRDKMDDIRKEGTFNKLLTRIGVIVLAPTYLLASFLLIASMLYALVALSGRKPEYHTLMSICLYAGCIELVGYFVRLGMVIYYRTTMVDTSLGMLADEGSPLFALDPFRIWFWVLVAIGVSVTRQLSRRLAVVSCAFMGLAAAGARVAISYAAKG